MKRRFHKWVLESWPWKRRPATETIQKALREDWDADYTPPGRIDEPHDEANLGPLEGYEPCPELIDPNTPKASAMLRRLAGDANSGEG